MNNDEAVATANKILKELYDATGGDLSKELNILISCVSNLCVRAEDMTNSFKKVHHHLKIYEQSFMENPVNER